MPCFLQTKVFMNQTPLEPTKEELLMALTDVNSYVGLLPTKEEISAVRAHIASLVARYISAQQVDQNDLYKKLWLADGPLRETAEKAYQERFPSRNKK